MTVLALAAVLLVLLVSPAQAATRQIVLGPGQHPSAVFTTPRQDDPRTVHAVWATTSGFDPAERVLNAIGYCRWRVGAASCEDRKTLLVFGREGQFSSPEITRVHEGRGRDFSDVLVITDTRCCGVEQTGRWMLTSRNGGTTWTTQRVSTMGGAHGSMLHRAGMFEAVYPQALVAPTVPSLTTIGGGWASFGFPVALDHLPNLYAPGTLKTQFQGFADDGGQTVHAEGMGILSDGRPFAVGYPPAERGQSPFVRTVLPGANPGSVASGWTSWRPLALPRHRGSVHTAIEDIAWGNFDEPALLMREILLPNDVLWAVPFAGGTPRRPALVAAATGSPVADRSAGSLAVFNDYGALWPTQQEACPRGRRCLVFRVTDGGAWTGPKDIVRSVPLDGPYFADATLTMAVGYGRIAGAWTERRPEASGLPEARLAYLCTGVIEHNTGCQKHERHLFDAPGSPNASLGAPNLVTGRAFNASVTGRHIRRVRISLLPPRCRPRSTGDQCFALRRPVRIARNAAPFTARFSRLPVASSFSTISVWQNRLCGVDAYLYRLQARVTFRGGQRVILRRNLSVCPPLP